MEKLAPVVKNGFTVWQSPHGPFQNKKAVDLSGMGKDEFSVFMVGNGYVSGVVNWLGKQSWFNVEGEINGHQYFAQYVHAKPIYPKGTKLKRGQKVGEMVMVPPIHLHFGIKIDGKWVVYLNYVDQDANKIRWGYNESNIWGTWDAYDDLYLTKTRQMYHFQKPLKIKTLNTKKMDLRKAPDTKKSYGKIVPVGYETTAKVGTTGERIDQNGRSTAAWVKIPVGDKVGWINRCWYNEEQGTNCTEYIKKLDDIHNILHK